MHEHDDIPVRKDSADESLVPSAWRPALAAIVAALARHDYRLAGGVEGVDAVTPDTADHLRAYIEDYGATLLPLPEQAWDTSVCIWMGGFWDVWVDLWTGEEGASDLVLQARVREDGGGYRIAMHMVYVP